MTLVLSVATPAYSLHVSDRLVSKDGTAHDPLANKTVVFGALDGLVVFGYTGLAFMDGMPTDTWIADAVSGGCCAGEGGAVRYGDFPVMDIGSSLRLVCQRLRAKRDFLAMAGEISAVGWQWDGTRQRALVRNVLWVLNQGSGKLRWTQIVPRHLPERKNVFRMTATGDWALSAAAWRELLDAVGAAGPDWELVEGLLVAAIREASTQKPGTIGSHCMSVLLRPWRDPNALVRFNPNTPHRGAAFGQTVHVAYSPWMVARDAIHSPAVLVGGLNSQQGLLTYSMQAPSVPADQALKGAFQSQKRPGR